MNSVIQEADQQFVSVYNRYPIILDHGEGMYLFDVDGKSYLDFGSGIGVCGLGYHDPNYIHIPDIVVSAKALGCGVPVGAIGTRGLATGVLGAGDHGTTYGSNPLATAAIVSVFQLFEQYHILSNVREMAAYLDTRLSKLLEETSLIKEIRGLGLMKGIELTVPAAPYIKALQASGIIVIPSGTHMIRLLPPLILQKEHIDEFIDVFQQIIIHVDNY